MKKLLIGLAISVLTSCTRSELATWNSEMNISIEIDGEKFEGVGSIEVVVHWDDAPLAPGAFVSVDYIGEAVQIDVGEHGVVFALWRTHQCEDEQRAVFLHGLDLPLGRHQTEKRKHRQQAKSALSAFVNSNSQFELSDSTQPVLIWFSDLSDPQTAQLVTPKTINSIFGDEAKIVSVNVGVSNAPRSPSTIAPILPWTDGAEINALNESEFSAELPNCLTRRDFLVE